MSLCTTCQPFSLDLADWEMYKNYSSGRSPFRRKIFDSGHALEISAQTCSLCRSFWNALGGSENGQVQSLEPVILRIWVPSPRNRNLPSVSLGLSSFTVHNGARMAYFTVAAAEG